VIGCPLGTLLGQRRCRHPSELRVQCRFLLRPNPSGTTRDRPWPHIPRLPLLLLVAANRPLTDPEDAGSLGSRGPLLDGPEHMGPEVV
jgi:hypothetical protein